MRRLLFSKILLYNNLYNNVENYYTVSIFFGMTESNRLDERRSKNLTIRLVLYYCAFFTIYESRTRVAFLNFG